MPDWLSIAQVVEQWNIFDTSRAVVLRDLRIAAVRLEHSMEALKH